MNHLQRSFVIILILLLAVTISSVSAASTETLPALVQNHSQNPGYYVMHWPDNNNTGIFFGSEFMGRIQNNSLLISVNDISRGYHRYSVISGNRTVFSDTLPDAPVSGEYVEVFPRWIQTRQPGPSANESVRTYRIYWPEDGVKVYIDGELQGTVTQSSCTIEIPGRNIPGHREYPKTITFRYPDGRKEQSFSVDTLPEVGGLTEYYLYWSAPFMYPAEPSRAGISHTVPGPIWTDRFDTYNLNFALASSGNAGALDTEQNGVVRMFLPDGTPLWSYYDFGKSTMVAVSGDGSLCAIGIRRDAWTVAESTGEVLLVDRDGTILWRKEMEHGIEDISISSDGSVILVKNGQTTEIFDRTGNSIGNLPVNYYRSVVVSSDGKWIASPRSDSIQYFTGNGTLVWSYPINAWITDISLSSDGSSGAAVSNDHVYYFTRDREITWQRLSQYRMSAVSLSADGRYLAGSSQYRLLYYDHSGNLLWHIEYPGYVNDVAVSGNGSVVAALFAPERAVPNHVALFDAGGRKLWDYQAGEKDPYLHRVVMSSDGNYLAANAGGTIYFFNRWGNATIIKPVTTLVPPIPVPVDSHTIDEPSQSPSRSVPLPAIISGAALVISAGAATLFRRLL